MTAFKRLSVGPTIPDLLRQDAERRTAQSVRALPTAVWCRTATLAVIRIHQLNGHQYELGSMAACPRQASPTRSTANPARVQAGAFDHAAQQPIRPSFNVMTRSTQTAIQVCAPAQAHRSWQCQAGMAACFAEASLILAAAQLLNWCRLLSPDGIAAAFKSAEQLTRAGMRLWRDDRT